MHSHGLLLFKGMGRSPPPPNSTDPLGEFATDLPEHFFYLLYQAAHHRDQRLGQRLAGTGVTVPRWRALAIIRRLAECTMTELARLTATDRTTLTRSVDHLVADGLVERKVPPTDRRLVMLSLTPAGHETYARCVAALLGLNKDIIEVVPADIRRELVRALEAITVKLVDDPEESEAIRHFTVHRP
ncbi:MAG: hypothetical protein JWM33_869 [Caulobacteraceae bacterium]|nr:hypothetical protein [Caulobacteraceae bacterium]